MEESKIISLESASCCYAVDEVRDKLMKERKRKRIGMGA